MSQLTAAGIDNIYVVHGITGYEEREKHLFELLKIQNDLDYQLVSDFPEEDENQLLIERFFSEDIRSQLTKGEIHCALIHLLCYQRMVENNDDLAIIFEDDVLFISDFPKELAKVVEETRSLDNGFMISLENSTLRFPSLRELRKDKYLYPAVTGRCAGAYILDRRAAERILEDLKVKKCNQTVDLWHNELISRKVFSMYWAHPALTEQGSSNGYFDSSLSTNKKGSLRYIKWEIQKFYKMYILRLFKF